MPILLVKRTGKNLRAKIVSLHAVNKTPDHYSENATECPRKNKRKMDLSLKVYRTKTYLIIFNN